MNVFFKLLFCTSLLSSSACTDLFFYPSKKHEITPKQIGLHFQDHHIENDNVKLHAWKLKAVGKKKGTILFLHGNAGNISSHLAAVYWIPRYGYEVFMLDYRGYGTSSGQTEIRGMHDDVLTTIDYLLRTEKTIGVFGQSLGASIAIYAVANSPQKEKIAFLIADSPFYDYSGIFREKVSNFPPFAPLAYPLSLLVSDTFSPEKYIERISPTPLLISHGTIDEIVPFHHGEKLFKRAGSPKLFWKVENGTHTLGFYKNEDQQKDFIKYVETYLNTSVRRE